MGSTKFFLVWSSGAILLTACSPKYIPLDSSVKIESRALSFPVGSYQYIVYIEDQLVAFAVDTSKPISDSMSFAIEGDSVLHPFNPQKDVACVRYTIYYVMGGVLPDGRLGLLKDCGGQAPKSISSIFAYNWKTGALEQLVNGPLPEGWSPKSYTWNPEMTRGIQEMTDGYQGTIYWVTSKGTSAIDTEIEDQGLKWNLKDYYEGKDRVGFVRSPAWSPDGTMIAFFASTYGIREDPLPKMDVSYEMYLMDSSTLRSVQVLPNVVDARLLRWSPDSQNLVFSGCINSSSRCGLWRYNLASKLPAFVASGDFQDFTWATNQKIAAIKNIEATSFKNNQIFEYTISEP